MKMTDGDGECVSGVIWLGYGGQRQQCFDHLLDLKLLRIAMANDRLFHKAWRILEDIESSAFRSQHSDPSHLTELQGDFYIGGEEAIFDCTRIRLVPVNDFFERL